MSSPSTKPLRVALVQRVLSPYRAPVFERLAARSELDLKVFHGKSVRGTKIKSAKPREALPSEELWTLTMAAKSSGRSVPLVFHPSLVWHVARFGPDVLLCEGNSNILNNVLLFAYAKLLGKKIVWWSLGQLPNRPYKGLAKYYLRLVRFLESRADAWMGYSSRARQHFLDRGFPPERVFRAVNCIDTDAVFDQKTQFEGQEETLRTELGLDGRWVVLFVGALVEAKRIDRLVRAFARLRENNPKAALLIVGDGTARQALESLAKELNVDEDTRFVGAVHEGVSRYFLLADTFVLPGLGGLAIPQAMAHSLPVLCGSADGTEEDYVRDGETGRVFSGESDEEIEAEIAAILAEWASDESISGQLGENALRLIQEQFNVHTFVDSVTECLMSTTAKQHVENTSS